MRRANVSLDADLVIEVMLQTGVRNARDAVEVALRDYLERRQRTETVTGDAVESTREQQPSPRNPDLR